MVVVVVVAVEVILEVVVVCHSWFLHFSACGRFTRDPDVISQFFGHSPLLS